MRKTWLIALATIALVVAMSGCGRRAADADSDPPAGESVDATPAASIEPSAAIGMTVAQAAERLKARGDVYVFTSEKHGVPASEFARSREATVADVSMEGGRVGLRVGPPYTLETPPWIRTRYRLGAWDFAHPDAIKNRGSEPCFECHKETDCSSCHVKLAAKALAAPPEADADAPEGAERIAEVKAAVMRALERTEPSSRLVDVTWGSGGYVLHLERDVAPKRAAVLWAEAAAVLGAQQSRNPWLEHLLIEWSDKGDGEPRAQLDVEQDHSIIWERVPASEVPGLAKSAKFTW